MKLVPVSCKHPLNLQWHLGCEVSISLHAVIASYMRSELDWHRRHKNNAPLWPLCNQPQNGLSNLLQKWLSRIPIWLYSQLESIKFAVNHKESRSVSDGKASTCLTIIEAYLKRGEHENNIFERHGYNHPKWGLTKLLPSNRNTSERFPNVTNEVWPTEKKHRSAVLTDCVFKQTVSCYWAIQGDPFTLLL